MNQNNSENTGLKCPKCGFLIKFSIDDILYSSKFCCAGCGLEFTLNRDEESKKVMELLQDVSVAAKNVEKVKKFG